MINKGAPHGFYFGTKTWNFIKNDGFLKILEENDYSTAFIQLFGLRFNAY